MEADLQNLRPAVGELNGDRSDRPYGEVGGEIREYGDCNFEVVGGVAEPEARDRGDIARTYLYFERVWGMTLTASERELFEQWHGDDRPDSWEKKRNGRIKAIQGVGNPFVEAEGDDNHGWVKHEKYDQRKNHNVDHSLEVEAPPAGSEHASDGGINGDGGVHRGHAIKSSALICRWTDWPRWRA